jgi:1-acyl-sn-glycerol-3-phosphate acyltransferase
VQGRSGALRSLALELRRIAGTLLGWGLFVAFTLVWGVLVIPSTLLARRLWPGAQEHYAWLTRAALRGFVAVLPFARIRVEGADTRLRSPRILVANHTSRLDSPVMLSLEPRLAGPVRAYMLRVPIVGTAIRLLGFFDADADAETFDAMNRAAEHARTRGGGLLFYPEGTRQAGGRIGHFHRGAFRAAYDHALPIQPVVIEGLDTVFPPGHVISPVHGRHLVRVRYLKPLRPPYGSGTRRQVVRALADEVRGSMALALERMRAERDGA